MKTFQSLENKGNGFQSRIEELNNKNLSLARENCLVLQKVDLLSDSLNKSLQEQLTNKAELVSLKDSNETLRFELLSLKDHDDLLVKENATLQSSILSVKTEQVEFNKAISSELHSLRSKINKIETQGIQSGCIENISNQVLSLVNENIKLKETLNLLGEKLNTLSENFVALPSSRETNDELQKTISQVNSLQIGCQCLEKLTNDQYLDCKTNLDAIIQEINNIKVLSIGSHENIFPSCICIEQFNDLRLKFQEILNNFLIQKQESLKLIQDEFDSLDKCYLDKLISSHPFQDMSRQLNLLSEDFLELKQYLTQQIEDLRGPPNVPHFNDRRDFHNYQRVSRPGFGSNNIAIELDRLRQAKSTAGDTYSNQQFMENNPIYDVQYDCIEEEPPHFNNLDNGWSAGYSKEDVLGNPNDPPFKPSKHLVIPWKGRILTPTTNQLREFEGNLNVISQVLGSREPTLEERNYKIRFIWKGYVLWPTPHQLAASKGDLNALLSICDHKSMLQTSSCFRRRNDGGSWRNSHDF